MYKEFRFEDFPDSFPDLDSLYRFCGDNVLSVASGVGVGDGGGQLITDHRGNQAYYKRNILDGSFIKSEPGTW